MTEEEVQEKLDERMYSDEPGKDKEGAWYNQMLIECLFSYMEKEIKHNRGDAFSLPKFFIEARKHFTVDEVQEMYKKVKEEMK